MPTHTAMNSKHRGRTSHLPSAVDWVKSTSHVNLLLQHRCLTSWGKLPQYKTFPLAFVLHKLCYLWLSFSPSFLYSFFLFLSHTNTRRQKEIKAPPHTPTSSTATTWRFALKPRLHTKHHYMLEAPMRHHETAHKAEAEARCSTPSPYTTGFTWMGNVMVPNN